MRLRGAPQLIGTGALVLAALALTSPAQAAFPGTNGEISFARANPPDTQADIYTIDEWSNAPATNITNQSYSRFSAWSPDGNRIAFSQNDKIYTANPDGTGKALVLDWTGPVWDLDWSPNGSQLAAELWTCDEDTCHQDVYTMDVDGTALTNITAANGFDDRHPAWSPDGTKIAFDSDRNGVSGIYKMSPDGSGETQLTQNTTGRDWNPDWSPSGARIAYLRRVGATGTEPSGFLQVMNADGSQSEQHPGGGFGPSWSPDGLYIALGGGAGGVITVPVDAFGHRQLTVPPIVPGAGGSYADLETDWRPRPAVDPPPTGSGYSRPKGASPLDVSLVPAYKECTEASANRTHGPPLGYPSCAPPVQTSGGTTVGTADSNGQPTQAYGRVKLAVLAGQPGGPDDADVKLDVSQTDVRRGGDLSDYEFGLDLRVPLRITDKWSGGGSDASATVTDLMLRFRVPCEFTDESFGNIGGNCHLSTTVEAVYLNAIPESKRSVWEIGPIALYNAGTDRSPDTGPDNSLFAVQGVLVP